MPNQYICDVCGKKSKLGGFINPMSPNPQVACYDCMIRTTAESKGISIALAEKQRNQALHVSNIFIDCKMKEYLSIARKSALDNLDEANKILQYVTNVWNTFDKKEKDLMAKKKEEAQSARILKEYRVKWNGPAHVPEGYAPDFKGLEREGVTDDGKPFACKFDTSCQPGGVARIMLDGAQIWSGYIWDGLGAIAKNPNIATFKIVEIPA